MSCPTCNSDNIKKNGFLPSGKQRWFCKDCKHYFSEEVIPRTYKEETVDGKYCPYCGGNLKYKGWNKSGSRRYLCKSCGKGCSGETPKRLNSFHSDLPCPYCGSYHAKKSGKLRNGESRYVCNDCGKGFSSKTKIQIIPQGLVCPECGSADIGTHGIDSKTGKQRYRCRKCKRRFVENASQPKFQVHEKECPYCGHVGAKKGGRSQGKQYYICLECNHKYLEGGKFQHLTKSKKDYIIEQMHKGVSQKDIAKEIGVNIKSINNFLRKTDEYKELRKKQVQYQRMLVNRRQKYAHILKIKNDLFEKYLKVNSKLPYKVFNAFPALCNQYLDGIINRKQFNSSVNKMIQENLEQQRLRYKQTLYTQKLKRACMEVMMGQKEYKIIKKYSLNKEHFKGLLKPLYTKEHISQQQINTIIQYGVGCAVPVDYLAPYIPCSQKMCERILKQYDITKKKRVPLSEQEKAFDKIWLDKYIG